LIKYRKDATRKRLPGSEYETRPKEDGKDVITTLDPAIQLICEDELRESVNRHNPEWACVLVMDPNSGEVLGVATAPTYDPNQYVLGDIQEEFNVLVHRTVEPGSTVKPLLASFAIEHGWVDVSSRFVCNRPLEIDGKILREAVHGTYFGDGSGVSVRKIVTQSSNVGMARIALALGQSRVMQAYQSFGFFRETGIELPLESAGLQPYYYISRNHKDVTWPKRVLANAGFGQGMTVTPLQLATAYSVIANGGYRVTPTLVRKADLPEQDEPSAAPGKLNLPSDETILLASSTPGTAAGFNDGTGRFRVLSKRTVDEITDWLVEVASSDGIGGNAQLARYTAAGKTGTAQIAATQGGYEPGAYTASFVGFFPAEKPQFVVLTMVVRPRGGEYYGGDVAAPLFKRVGDRISYLDQLIPMEEANAT
jgi:cell division protein FtsI/penicillin-binding protein 2